MKTNEEIKQSMIIVAKFAELAICGRTIIKRGSILKVAFNCPSYRSYIKVFRNKIEEREDDWRTIDRMNIREATEEEINMWNKEMYFVKSLQTI